MLYNDLFLTERTEAFQNWFAGSQAVDPTGQPLVLYHGTSKDQDFKHFRMPKNGVWFTTDPKDASDYAMENDSQTHQWDHDSRSFVAKHTASRVIPVYLKIINPKRYGELPPELRHAENYRRAQGVLFDRLRAEGYDSVIIGDHTYVLLDYNHPDKVKSAIGNKTFSNKKNIHEMRITEAMSFDELDPEHAYEIFRRSYEAETGTSWSKEKFISRARWWTFFGDSEGYVAIRVQRSGFKKLVGVAGNPRSILRGLTELQQEGGPIWGAVSAPLAQMAKKRGMIVPHLIPGGPLFIRALVTMIPPEVFGGIKPRVQRDGGIILDYADVGTAVKYLIGSKEYFQKILGISGVVEKLKAIPGAKMVLRLMGLSMPMNESQDEHLQKLQRVLRFLSTDPRLAEMRDRMTVFGSAAQGKARPKDIDLMVNYHDFRGSAYVPDQIQGANLLLALARKYYGLFDPFIRVGPYLYTRNDAATGWITARNVRGIEKGVKTDGKPIADVSLAGPLTEEVIEEWHGKHVVQQIGQYRIAVDSPGRATYVSVWTPDNKCVGNLTTRGGHLRDQYLGIGKAELSRAHRGKGLGLAMYRALLANLDPQWKGIASYLPDRSNRKQVPKIYRRLGGFTPKGDEDHMIIPRQ